MSDPSIPQYPVYSASPEQWPSTPARPASVSRAMQFMYAGAALSLVTLVIGVADASGFKSTIRKAFPHYSQAQVNNTANALVVVAVVAGLVGVGLWLWMAWANGRGRNWARVLSSVLFGIDTLSLVANLSQHVPTASLLAGVVQWAIGLGAIMYLWNKQSSQYFSSRR